MSNQIFGKYGRLYWEKGYSVIPVDGKKPAIKGWNQYSTKLPEKEVFESWEKQFPNHNIGLVVGPQSKCSALDIDIRDDEAELLEYIEQFVPESPVRKRGKKAYTSLYQASDLPSRSFASNGEKKVEFFSSHRQIVIPPSIHPETKEPYEWLDGKSLLEVNVDDLPPITSGTLKKLESAISDLNAPANELVRPKQERGFRNDTLKDICSRLIFKRKTDEDIAQVLLEIDAIEHRDNPLFVERRHSTDSTDPTINALDFVRSIRQAIDAGRIREGKETLRPSYSKHAKPICQINLVPLTELSLKKFEEQSWVLEGILPTGGTSVLVGQPKIGKTTLVRQLALAVARGSDFAGRKTVKGRVLLFALEEKESEVQKHFVQLGGSTEDIYVHCGRLENVAPAFIESVVVIHNPKLVIVDTLFHLTNPEDTNSYTDMTKRMYPFIDLARRTGCHILFTHHTNKNSEVSGTNSIMGSNAILGAVDSAIMFIKRNGKLILDVTQRYGPRTSIQLKFNENRSFGVENKSDQSKLVLIVEHLEKNGPCSKNAIVRAVGGNKEAVLEEIDEAIGIGELVEIKSSGLHPLISLPTTTGEPQYGNPQ